MISGNESSDADAQRQNNSLFTAEQSDPGNYIIMVSLFWKNISNGQIPNFFFRSAGQTMAFLWGNLWHFFSPQTDPGILQLLHDGEPELRLKRGTTHFSM